MDASATGSSTTSMCSSRRVANPRHIALTLSGALHRRTSTYTGRFCSGRNASATSPSLGSPVRHDDHHRLPSLGPQRRRQRGEARRDLPQVVAQRRAPLWRLLQQRRQYRQVHAVLRRACPDTDRGGPVEQTELRLRARRGRQLGVEPERVAQFRPPCHAFHQLHAAAAAPVQRRHEASVVAPHAGRVVAQDDAKRVEGKVREEGRHQARRPRVLLQIRPRRFRRSIGQRTLLHDPLHQRVVRDAH